MSMTQSLGRTHLSLLIAGMLLAACGDDGSGSNEQAQSADAGGSTAKQSSPRGGRGGSAANNTASAGRSGAAGRQVVRAGAGNSGANAGNSGAAAPSGGSGGAVGIAGANAPVPDAGMRQSSDQDAGPVDTGRMSLTDAQIAGVLSAVNTAETGAGAFAVMRATSPAVRQFAQSMVEMHGAAQERDTALFNTLNLTVSTTTLSAQLTDDATTTMQQLMSVIDTEFDAAYIRSQVEAHMKVLMIIDEQLLPNVVADALRAELVLTRSQVAMHMDAARAALPPLEQDTDAGVVTP